MTMQPTYYVRHPDDSYSVADPQPVSGEFRIPEDDLGWEGSLRVGHSRYIVPPAQVDKTENSPGDKTADLQGQPIDPWLSGVR